MSQDRVAVVIPSRYASSRFPGKPLAMLCGKPMVQHVYEKAAASTADLTVVATDHQAIYDTVAGFGGRAVMTAESHPSGTDRIAEAVSRLGEKIDIVVNVQGDEPLIPTSVIDELIVIMKSDPAIEMATVAVPGDRSSMTENNVKVVFGSDRFALYFSRSMIPFLRSGGEEAPVYLHWGHLRVPQKRARPVRFSAAGEARKLRKTRTASGAGERNPDLRASFGARKHRNRHAR